MRCWLRIICFILFYKSFSNAQMGNGRYFFYKCFICKHTYVLKTKIIHFFLIPVYYPFEKKQFRDVLETFSSMSLLQCAIICSLQPDCKAINVISNNGDNIQCQLATGIEYEDMASTMAFSQCKFH